MAWPDTTAQGYSTAGYSVATSHRAEDSDGRALLAIGASLCWPGLGQFIAGYAWTGMFFSIVASLIVIAAIEALADPRLLPIMAIAAPVGLVLQIVQLLNAARCGRTSEKPMLGNGTLRMMVGALLAMAAIGGDVAVIHYLQNNCLEISYSPTPSMSPAIAVGDAFLTYPQMPFTRWDIVAVDLPDDWTFCESRLVKRVVGLPGETVEITGDALLIDGKPIMPPPGVGPYVPMDLQGIRLLEPAPAYAGHGCWGRPIKLASDEYYLLGDNSAISADCRFFPSVSGRQPGAVPRSRITGRIVARIWPIQRWHCFESSADQR